MGLFSKNDVTGYNRQNVEELRNVINNTAQAAGSEIPEILKNGIITPISTAWYAPEAVKFFSDFAEIVKASGTAITEAFDSFRDAVQKAGANWAENTGGEVPSLAAIETVNLTLDVSAIQAADSAGSVTITGSDAENVAKKLPNIEEEIKSKLQDLAKNLDAETAFIGGGQSAALQDCFVRVSGEVHRIFKFLTEGEGSLQSQINQAVAKYGQVSEGISSAFNGS